MAILDLIKKKKNEFLTGVDVVKNAVSNGVKSVGNDWNNDASGLGIAKNTILGLPSAAKTTYDRVRTGTLGEGISNDLQKFDYFKPTENVRVRDFARELPKGIDEGIQGFARNAARFGISAMEAPNAIRTGRSTGKYYNTPFGRINSFQSEAQNRVQRGDPLWKAIGNPALDTVLAGADVGAVAKPLISGAKSAISLLPKNRLTNEAKNIATDLLTPLNQKRVIPGKVDTLPERFAPGYRQEVPGIPLDTKPGRFLPEQSIRRTADRVESVPFQPKSRLFQGVMKPGLTIEDVSGGVKGYGKQSVPAVTPAPVAPKPSEIPLIQDAKRAMNGSPVRERGFITSVKEGEKTPEALKNTLSGDYAVLSDSERIASARKFLTENPQEAEARAFNPKNFEDITLGNQLLDSYIANGQLDKVDALTKAMAESGTDLGRAVKSFADYDKTTPAGAIRWAQTKIRQYNKSNPNKPLSLQDSDVQALMDKAHQVQSMPAGRERNIEAYKLSEQINNLIPSSIIDKALTVWKAGLLTSLRTTGRNLIGNAVHTAAEIAKDLPATMADKVMSARTGQRSLSGSFRGMGEGLKKGAISAKDIITTGYDPEEAFRLGDMNRITWGNNRAEKVLKGYTDAVFRTLGAQDKIFWHPAFLRSLNDQATAMAINSGRKGDRAFIENLVKNPTKTMADIATKEANTAVFKNENVMGSLASKVKNFAKGDSGYGRNKATSAIGKIVGEVAMPFTGVPSSIAGQTIAYSPIGLMKGIYRTGKVLAKNVPELQRQAAQELGRGVVGTGLWGLGAYLMGKGLMTGQPKDVNEAQQWQMEGKQANSIFINGKWRSINSVGPEALALLAGSKVQEEMSKESPSAGALGMSLAKDQLNQTMLSGVQQPLQAITDPARYGKSYVNNMAGSVVPNVVKDTAKSFDPNMREINTAGDAISNGIPGLRNTLLPKRDTIGNIIPNDQTGISAFIDVFNSKTPSSDPVIQELSRLYESGNDATPGKLGSSYSVFGQKVKLNPQEMDALESQSRGALMSSLNFAMSSPSYKGLSDEEKKKILSNTVDRVREMTKKDIALNGIGGSNGNSSLVETANAQTPQAGVGGFNASALNRKQRIEMEKMDFEKSDETFRRSNGYVFRKNAYGEAQPPMREVEYDYKLTGSGMALDKAKEDYASWIPKAEKQITALENLLNDPMTDELDRAGYEKDLVNLIEDYQRYQSYGGFKKPKSSGGASTANPYKGLYPAIDLALMPNLKGTFRKPRKIRSGMVRPSSMPLLPKINRLIR